MKRGYCCGSGCRHCPYHHVNIKSDYDKACKIQQPSFLYFSSETPFVTTIDNNIKLKNGDNNTKHCDLYVLFFSGGKDSFLAIRAIIRHIKQKLLDGHIHLILLTTFDATSRMVAHQDISIHDVMKQAKHLKISLVGVPLHRKSSVSYINRLDQTFQYIEKETKCPIVALVFGDLHLDTIIQWRQKELGTLVSSISGQSYQLLFPLNQIDYTILECDLVYSQVPCFITATTLSCSESSKNHFFPPIVVGAPYNKELREQIKKYNNDQKTDIPIDVFGENGEFHTIVKVWDVSREIALSL
jgi:diphthamide synthase (EF-2-diphthine--ammonia ligase)